MHILSLPLPLLSSSDQEAHAHGRCCRQSSNDGNAHQTLLCDLVIDQLAQTLRLQIARLDLEQVVVVSPCLGVVAKLVVAQGKIVQTLSTSVRRGTEYVAQEPDALLLLRSRR